MNKKLCVCYSKSSYQEICMKLKSTSECYPLNSNRWFQTSWIICFFYSNKFSVIADGLHPKLWEDVDSQSWMESFKCFIAKMQIKHSQKCLISCDICWLVFMLNKQTQTLEVEIEIKLIHFILTFLWNICLFYVKYFYKKNCSNVF